MILLKLESPGQSHSKKDMKMKGIKKRNFVQEYSLQINRSQIFRDRKRLSKSGYVKHKSKMF